MYEKYIDVVCYGNDYDKANDIARVAKRALAHFTESKYIRLGKEKLNGNSFVEYSPSRSYGIVRHWVNLCISPMWQGMTYSPGGTYVLEHLNPMPLVKDFKKIKIEKPGILFVCYYNDVGCIYSKAYSEKNDDYFADVCRWFKFVIFNDGYRFPYTTMYIGDETRGKDYNDRRSDCHYEGMLHHFNWQGIEYLPLDLETAHD